MVTLPAYLIHYFLEHSNEITYCRQMIFLNFTNTISGLVTGYSIMGIALDRYYAVMKPFSRRLTQIYVWPIIIIIWIVSGMVSVPIVVIMTRRLQILKNIVIQQSYDGKLTQVHSTLETIIHQLNSQIKGEGLNVTLAARIKNLTNSINASSSKDTLNFLTQIRENHSNQATGCPLGLLESKILLYFQVTVGCAIPILVTILLYTNMACRLWKSLNKNGMSSYANAPPTVIASNIQFLSNKSNRFKKTKKAKSITKIFEKSENNGKNICIPLLNYLKCLPGSNQNVSIKEENPNIISPEMVNNRMLSPNFYLNNSLASSFSNEHSKTTTLSNSIVETTSKQGTPSDDYATNIQNWIHNNNDIKNTKNSQKKNLIPSSKNVMFFSKSPMIAFEHESTSHFFPRDLNYNNSDDKLAKNKQTRRSTFFASNSFARKFSDYNFPFHKKNFSISKSSLQKIREASVDYTAPYNISAAEKHRHLRNKQAAKMVITLVILYLACNIPFYIFSALGIRGVITDSTLIHIHNLFIHTDHWLHLAIYLVFNANFRAIFVKRFIKCQWPSFSIKGCYESFVLRCNNYFNKHEFTYVPTGKSFSDDRTNKSFKGDKSEKIIKRNKHEVVERSNYFSVYED
ncbi:unnamed protein product [Gordionus sp. m RMFG-2023]